MLTPIKGSGAVKTERQPSEKAKAFLGTVDNGSYRREIVKGLQKFVDKNVPADMQTFYSASELEHLIGLRGTGRDIESRMPVKITRHY